MVYLQTVIIVQVAVEDAYVGAAWQLLGHLLLGSSLVSHKPDDDIVSIA